MALGSRFCVTRVHLPVALGTRPSRLPCGLSGAGLAFTISTQKGELVLTSHGENSSFLTSALRRKSTVCPNRRPWGTSSHLDLAGDPNVHDVQALL
jgi:transposase